ncbi:hypothetical protein [Streptomyces bohaiensis]|uniref:hypothetical protein n=1 Tax=Streptomyces bohaiensis TaxID=1431344 RepID=UPI003B80C77D
MDDPAPETSTEFPVRPVEEVREEVRALAGRLEGLVAPSLDRQEISAYKTACSMDYGRSDLFSASASARLEGAPEDELESGMTRVRDDLEESGWEILMFEPNSSPVQAWELRAEKVDEGLFLRALFTDARTGRLPEGEVSDVYLNVFTQCWTDPEAED